jgi:hypothetical protein
MFYLLFLQKITIYIYTYILAMCSSYDGLPYCSRAIPPHLSSVFSLFFEKTML